MNETKERTLGVRLQPEDEAAVKWLHEYVQASSGRGVRISEADAVRWALHSAVAALSADVAEGETKKRQE